MVQWDQRRISTTIFLPAFLFLKHFQSINFFSVFYLRIFVLKIFVYLISEANLTSFDFFFLWEHLKFFYLSIIDIVFKSTQTSIGNGNIYKLSKYMSNKEIKYLYKIIPVLLLNTVLSFSMIFFRNKKTFEKLLPLLLYLNLEV